ncbi:MAG: YdeI/OmpD-associated family protein [Chitinophagales bacterium]|nr:YdeI family protein [Chitinophagaceae bacterium]MCB9065738.1 YdeI/OmpD-associated family protein [Chitinophagales bacterium]
MNPKVDFFFDKDTQWQKEYKELRKIALSCGLQEELKWGCPCYTYNGTNVVLIHGFKDYCAYLFHKGALLSNADNLLIQQTENVQSARQIRFTSLKEIVKLSPTLKSNIYEAIEVEKAGLKVTLKKTKEYSMPDELQDKLDRDAEFKTAFEALTPGRQRGYLLHFSQPKQSKTRISRIEKCTPLIFEGKGYND